MRSAIRAITTLALVLAPGMPAAGVAPAPREFRIDSAHSRVTFSIPFLGSRTRGEFDDVQGMLSVDSTLSGRCGVTARIATASIHTGSTHRDGHLRSSDFFDAERYPAITFRSDGVRCERGSCVVSGALTMHGVTRPVRIEATLTLPITPDPHGLTLVVFHGTTRIARKDFGILGGSRYNEWFDELRSRTMGDTVDIELDLGGFAFDYDRWHDYDAAVARVEQRGVSGVLARVRALAAHPDSLAAWSWGVEHTGFALIGRGRNAEGLAVLRTFAEALPDTAAGFGLLARGYELAGKPDSARVAAGRALASRPDDPRANEVSRRLR